MDLGPRLSAVASLVPPGIVAADIGTERALLPVYLVKIKDSPKVVAVDKSPHNVKFAKETIHCFDLKREIEIRWGEGFSPLREEDGVEVVIVAGVGGKTICEMLKDLPPFVERCRRLVFQPMGDAPLIRQWLAVHGFSFPEEKLALEKGRYYPVIAAEKGRLALEDPFLLEIGPGLLQGKDPLLISWLNAELERCQSIVLELNHSRKQEDRLKAEYYRKRCLKLEGVLEDVRDWE